MSAYIFDTETTGINEARIIEAAWIKLATNSVNRVENFLQRYNPGKRIDLGAMAVHPIIDEDLADMPPHTDFKLPADTEYLIGHNIDFDWKVAGQPEVRRICTLALSRHFWPELGSHTQSAMLYHFIGKHARPLLKEAHSAYCDVSNNHIILTHMVEKIFSNNPFTWEELWLVSEKARVPTVMPFGKHKGTLIKDIPWDYKSWLLRQPDTDPYLIQAIRGDAA